MLYRVLVLFLFAGIGLAHAKRPTLVSLEDVVKKVSTENYTVYENALRVYQAKESIQVARGNLLPKLNVWKVVSLPFSPLGIFDLVEDIAPFLVRSNWFRFKEQKLLYFAEKEAYRALWANQVMTAKSLFVHLLLDQALLEHIKEGQRQLEELLVIVESRELLGGADQGATRDIEVRLLALQEDRRSLEVLIAEEESLLGFMMGYTAEVEVKPASIRLPNFDGMEPLEYADFEFRALDSSPEVRQFDHLIAASDYVRKEATYSFLGASSVSRGVMGGIFDSLPQQQGLGFGTPASRRIVSAEKEKLQIQKKGIAETIKRQLKLLVDNYNLDLENYANLKRRVELTETTINQLYERLNLGQNVPTIDLIEASRNHIQADTAFFAVQYRFLTNEDKLARLIFHGDYTMKPATVDVFRKKQQKPVQTKNSGRKGV